MKQRFTPTDLRAALHHIVMTSAHRITDPGLRARVIDDEQTAFDPFEDQPNVWIPRQPDPRHPRQHEADATNYLDAQVKAAIRTIRAGRPDLAQADLTRAQQRAATILIAARGRHLP